MRGINQCFPNGARGFRKINNHINMIYFLCGKLTFYYPRYLQRPENFDFAQTIHLLYSENYRPTPFVDGGVDVGDCRGLLRHQF